MYMHACVCTYIYIHVYTCRIEEPTSIKKQARSCEGKEAEEDADKDDESPST